jgi:predicted metal-binding membrane protein
MVASDQVAGRSSAAVAEWLRDPGRLLWTIAALCWVALLAAGHHHDGLISGGNRPESAAGIAVSVALLAAAWLEMTAAMMLPTTIPMVRMFTVVSARAPRTAAVRTAFLAGYLALWLAFALAAVAVATVLRAWAPPAQLNWIAARPHLVLAAVLAIAGVFQLTPLKDRCLTQCRDPRAFLFAHYRRGVAGAWNLGLRHGWSCLGCCWALMLIMFGTGLGNVLAMLALTAVMLIEKTASWGRRIVTPLGIGLLATAALVGLFGNHMPGWELYEPLQSSSGTHHH